jgi:hypothetical protein
METGHDQPNDLHNTLFSPLIDAFEEAITGAPRSQQQLIGPSEIGIECDRCLAKKLAGVPERRDAAWYPAQGTAVHSWAEHAVIDHFPRGVAEKRVIVGILADRLIGGTCDLYDTQTYTILDFKHVGSNTIKSAKVGPKVEYRKQVHMYGRGYQLDGHRVDNVAILYIPRTEPTLRSSYFWHEPYDQRVAQEALDRAQKMMDFIIANGNGAIVTLPQAPGCYSCNRYDLLPGESRDFGPVKFDGII